MKTKLVKKNLNDILKPKLKEDIIKDLSNLSQEEKNIKLRIASYNGYLDLVKLLINNGADVNAKNNFGFTSLMLASVNDHMDIVNLLIKLN
jgi:ankyrin repeat protein